MTDPRLQRRDWRSAFLAACFFFVQLCVPGLQASMLELAPQPAAHHGSHDGPHDSAPSAKHLKCAICAAASLPASLPPPSPAVIASVQTERAHAAGFANVATPHLPHGFAARAPPFA